LTRRIKVGLVLAAAVLVLAATAGAVTSGGAVGGTIVFGSPQDPVVLDGALVSDGPSLSVIDQMFEGLTTLKPGSTVIQPGLATSWLANKTGLVWTFKLRHGVKFQDGTPFNAAAVCFNFSRWYNFTGSFQNPDATYYWQTVFGGFRNPEPGSPTSSLYKGCKAVGQFTVRLYLQAPRADFLGALALTNFAIASPTALKKYGADQGSVDSSGVFHPTGSYGTQHPVGTGPFQFVSWRVGDKLVLKRFAGYWGQKAKLDQVIFRPIPNNAARVQALQSGEIQGFDLVAPEDRATISSNPNLKLLSRPAFNVAYVGFNVNTPPMNNLKVRQAVAYGLDRASVVKAFYPPGAVVAKEFMPPQLFGWSADVPTYNYDPDKSKALLQSAGFKLPVAIDFWYPTNVSRPYMPDPKKNAEAFGASLEKAGFKVTFRTAPWRPDYLSNASRGKAMIYLLGWTGDYGDPDNFIGTFFRTPQDQWGSLDPKIYAILNQALKEPNVAKRTALYQQANKLIMTFLPGVPYAHTSPALAFQKKVQGYRTSPVSLESFAPVFFAGGK
jgi:peptide/nickel transport system substrate-binding protein